MTARKAAPRKAAARKAPAKQAPEVQTEAADAAASPAAAAPTAVGAALYPQGTPLFEHKTASGLTVVFPKITSRELPREFWWTIYKLDPVFQAFEWMNRFGVPDALQAAVVRLPDEQFDALFDAWYADAGFTAGE